MHAVRRNMKEEAAITLLHGFCSRLSTASLNHPPFTFYNARGLRIVKCPLRMKRTSSFVCDCVLEEQSLSVLSLSAKTRHSVLVHFRRMRRVFVRMCFIDVDCMFDSLCCGNRFVCVFDSLCSGNRFICVFDSLCCGNRFIRFAFDSLCCGNRLCSNVSLIVIVIVNTSSSASSDKPGAAKFGGGVRSSGGVADESATPPGSHCDCFRMCARSCSLIVFAWRRNPSPP